MKPVKQENDKLVVPTDSSLLKKQKQTLVYLENQSNELDNGVTMQKTFAYGGDQMSTLSVPISGENDSAEKNSLVMVPPSGLQFTKSNTKVVNFFESRMPVVKMGSYNEAANLKLNVGGNEGDGDLTFFSMQSGIIPNPNNKPNQTFSRLGSLLPEMDNNNFEKHGLSARMPNVPTGQLGLDGDFFRQATGSSHDEFFSPPYNMTQFNLMGQNPSFKFPQNLEPIDVFPPIEAKGPKLQNFNMLYEVLVKIFCEGKISENDLMMIDSAQESILNSFFMRKFFKKLRADELTLDNSQKCELINRIVSTRTSKRPEEFFKFVLTRVIKTLKKSFKAEYNPSGDIDVEFYSHYFKDIAKKLGISIDLFFYPLTGKATNKTESGQKKNMKLNASYYNRIFQSTRFLDAMNTCLDEIKEDYSDEIRKKLESLLMKWDAELDPSLKNLNNFVDKITQYLEKNKRCKLPWTISEVEEATDRFKMLVDSVLSDLAKKGSSK